MVAAIVSAVVSASLGALLATGILNLGYETVKRASQKKGATKGFWGHLFGDRAIEVLEEQPLRSDVALSRGERRDELIPWFVFTSWQQGQYYPTQGQRIFASAQWGALRQTPMETFMISEWGGKTQPTTPPLSLHGYNDSYPMLGQQRH